MNELAKSNEVTQLAELNKYDLTFGDEPPQMPSEIGMGSIKVDNSRAEFIMSDDTIVSDFEAHVIFWYETRNFYPEIYSKDNKALCQSLDGKHPHYGIEMLEGECKHCPQNQFGSRGKGRACRHGINLILLLDDYEMPLKLSCAQTSVMPTGVLVQWLSNVKYEVKDKIGSNRYQYARAKFSLESKQFTSGTAAILQVRTVSVLDPSGDGMEKIGHLAQWWDKVHTAWVQSCQGAASDAESASERKVETAKAIKTMVTVESMREQLKDEGFKSAPSQASIDFEDAPDDSDIPF